MRIVKFCGRERLQGGERLWRRMARAVQFEGRVLVFGYGVGGMPGREHRRAERTGDGRGMVLADFEPGLIRIWVPCHCAAAEPDLDELATDHNDPLGSFAHELGHHIQYIRRGLYYNEGTAERYGRFLLRRYR